MKTFQKFKFTILTFFIAALLVSCNQSARNKKNTDSTMDTTHISAMDNSNYDESVQRAQLEMDRMWARLDSLQENDPDFNQKLDRELDNFNDSMDSLADNLRREGHDLNSDANKRYDELRLKSKELKDKLKRWSDKTGDNLNELGEDIKRNFRDFKESLKGNDNK